MLEILDRIYEFLEEKRDPRTVYWFLGNTSPLPCLSIVLFYILLVKVFLPKYMKNRKPYKLTNVIFYYNVFQVVLSLIMAYMGYGSGYFRRFSIWKCRDLDRSITDPDAIMAARAIYLYYIAKFTEFLDTIFFVLRKKDKQVSFLHVYHHATMAFNVWIGVVFMPGGCATMVVAANSSIHVVMYSYYLLSGLGPQWQKYLWWKKYLTWFQIIQFMFGITQCIMVLGTLDNCPEVTKLWPLVAYLTVYLASLLILFCKFYIQAYNNTSKTNNKLKNKNESNNNNILTINNNILHNKVE